MDSKNKQRIVIAFALLVWLVLPVFVDGGDTLTEPFFLAALAIGGVQLGIALWMFRDAQRRGVGEPIVWFYATIVPIIGLIGLVAYLLYRPTEIEK